MSKIILDDVETENIDRLYLELSQFTQVKTKKEIALGSAIKEAHAKLVGYSNVGGCIHDDVYHAICTLRDALTYLVTK